MDSRRTLAFWSQVAPYNLDDPDDCALWTGATNAQGYGKMSLDGEVEYAHRTAFKILHGDDSLDGGLIVLHACHNPQCVRFSHLSAGDAAENASQRESAGRGRVHPPLTDDDVRAVRFAYVTGRFTQADLAEAYLGDPTGQRTIGLIVTGKNRASAGGPTVKRGSGTRPPRRP